VASRCEGFRIEALSVDCAPHRTRLEARDLERRHELPE